MNIFILDYNPELAAEYHCDKHVVKMILESAQLLSTAHHVAGSPHRGELYKPTHRNHPCAIWVRESAQNYQWTYHLLNELLGEYTKRYRRIHKTTTLVDKLQFTPESIPDVPSTPFVQCMPDVYKCINPVEAYRAYYKGEKAGMAVWAHGPQPAWWV